MNAAEDSSQRIDASTDATATNRRLDNTTVDSALGRILAAMKSLNEELD